MMPDGLASPDTRADAPSGPDRGAGPVRAPVGFTPAAALVALAAVVAVAAHGNPVWAPFREGRADAAEVWATALLALGVGVVGAAVVLAALRLGLASGGRAAPPLPQQLLRALPVASVLIAALVLFRIAALVPEPLQDGVLLPAPYLDGSRVPQPLGISDDRAGFVVPDEPNVRYEEPEPPPPEASPASRLALAVLLALIAALAVRHLLRWRPAPRRQVPVPAPPPPRAVVRAALEVSIDAMLADADPDTAVIGAYARLLEALDAGGAGREPQEGPVEHVERVLHSLRVRPEPVRTLVALFEVARFSSRGLTPADRERALQALQAAAADLAGVAETAAATGVVAA